MPVFKNVSIKNYLGITMTGLSKCFGQKNSTRVIRKH